MIFLLEEGPIAGVVPRGRDEGGFGSKAEAPAEKDLKCLRRGRVTGPVALSARKTCAIYKAERQAETDVAWARDRRKRMAARRSSRWLRNERIEPKRTNPYIGNIKERPSGCASFPLRDKTPNLKRWRMSEFLMIATVSSVMLVGVVIYLLLGTVRAALASHEREE